MSPAVLQPDHWDIQYHSPPNWDNSRACSELQRVLARNRVPPGRALELGCGTGTNAVWLAQEGFDVAAIDLSATAVRRARRRASAAGVAVRWNVADLLESPDLGRPFDFVFDRGCWHAVRLADAAGYIGALLRFTRPRSLVLVLAGNAHEPETPAGPPVVDEATIRRELGVGFEILGLDEFRFDGCNDGTRPLGWSCLLRRPADGAGSR